jgi:hypothetical protein
LAFEELLAAHAVEVIVLQVDFIVDDCGYDLLLLLDLEDLVLTSSQQFE